LTLDGWYFRQISYDVPSFITHLIIKN